MKKPYRSFDVRVLYGIFWGAVVLSFAAGLWIRYLFLKEVN